jgi:hypothetical protein
MLFRNATHGGGGLIERGIPWNFFPSGIYVTLRPCST